MPSLEELGRKVKAKYPEYADIPDLELGRKVKLRYPEYDQFNGSEADQPKQGGLLKTAVNALPVAGATVGSLVGAPFGPVAQRAGAAIGGGGGEAFRQVAGGIGELTGHPIEGVQVPETSGEAIKQILGQGAVGAATELGGQYTGKFLGAAGQRLLGTAVGRSALKSVAKRFPGLDVPAIMQREGIPVGRTLGVSKKGSEIAAKKVAEKSAVVNSLLQQAEGAGHRVATGDVLRPVLQYAADLEKKPASAATAKAIRDFISEDVLKHGASMTPTAANQLIQDAQEIGFQALKELDISAPAKRQYTVQLQRAGNAALKNIPQYGSEIARAKSRLQGVLGARMAAELGERAGGGRIRTLAAPAAVGAGAASFGGGNPAERATRGIGAAAATRALTGPSALSSLAFLLSNPLLAPLLTLGVRTGIQEAR